MSNTGDYLNLSTAPSTQLRPSWDIPGSFFKSLELLHGLVKASSQDDVHPQAVLAAEALGAGVLVAPERIKDALKALDADRSFRLEQTRISVGIHYGNTQRAIQSSSSLLQFFVFCTPFRLVYIDEEIGDIIFEMISITGLLSKHPVSPHQITRLTGQVAAHMEQSVPTDLMHEIASIVAEYDPSPVMYTRMSHKALSKLLVSIFENIRDAEARSLCLTGHECGIWIAASLLWWLGETACLEIDRRLVYGTAESRLTIVLDTKRFVSWNLDVYRQTTNPTRFVVDSARDDHFLLNRIPLNNLMHYFNASYWAGSGQAYSSLAQQTTAELATALILLLSEDGTIFLDRSCCNSGPLSEPCTKTHLSSIVQPEWLARIHKLVIDYGWEETPDVTRLSADMKDALMKTENEDSIRKPVLVWHRERHWLKSSLKNFCNRHIQSRMGDDTEPDFLRDPAYSVALDAILTSTVKSGIKTRYTRMPDTEAFDENEELIVDLLTHGLQVRKFRTLALQRLLTGLREVEPSSLISSSSGIVAGMSLLWNRICDPREACAIRVIRGTIKHDGTSYVGVRETVFQDVNVRPADQCPPAVFTSTFRQGKDFTTLKLPGETESYDLEMLVSASGSYLSLKSYMVRRRKFSSTPAKSRASWIDAIDSLTTATHMMDATYPNLVAEFELGRSLKARMTNRSLRWVPPMYRTYTEDETCLIVNAGEDQSLRIFCAAKLGVESEHKNCHPLIIHSNGSVLTSLQRASNERTWTLLM